MGLPTHRVLTALSQDYVLEANLELFECIDDLAGGGSVRQIWTKGAAPWYGTNLGKGKHRKLIVLRTMPECPVVRFRIARQTYVTIAL